MASLRARLFAQGIRRMLTSSAEPVPPYDLSPRQVRKLRALIDGMNRPAFHPRGVESSRAAVGGVEGTWLEPRGGADRVVVHFHGGGYLGGSAHGYFNAAGRIAQGAAARVFVPDYRLAPEHPFPAAFDDGCSVLRALLASESPRRLIAGGDSAGGGLLLAATMALRSAGEAMPAALYLLSPWTDLSLSGESIVDRAALDPMLRRGDLARNAHIYLAGHPPEDPRASPVFGQFEGLPPARVMVGQREILFDDAKRVCERARAVGSDFELVVGEAMFHIWPLFAPIFAEAGQELERLTAFIARHADD